MYQIEANNIFILNETTGSLIVNSVLEPNQKLNLTVYAVDRGSPQLSSDTVIDVFVYPSPDHVRFTSSSYMFVVPEDEPRGSLIGQVEAFVIDDSNATNEKLQVAYSITTQSSLSVFSIRNTTGDIHLDSFLDYDMIAHQHRLSIQATYQLMSGILLTSEIAVIIEALDVNDNPPQFTPGFYSIPLVEPTPAGTSILRVLATDVDEDSYIIFSLEGEDSDPFMIDSQTGVVYARNNLTIAQDYRFHVIASDRTLTSQAVVHISVSRQRSIKPTFTKEQYIFNISENVHPIIHGPTQIDIGRVEALSFGGRYSHEFPNIKFRISTPVPFGLSSSMNSEPEVTLFEINETTGMISTISMAEFDAESRENYFLYVEVYNNTDGISFDKATVEVKINDVNDNSPMFNQSLYTHVIENSLSFGSYVLKVSASDRDSSTNADIVYTLLPITLGFAINSTSGEITTENTTLILGTYHLNVLATDKGSPPQNGSVSAYITIISAALTVGGIQFTQSVYNFQILENILVGSIIGEVQVRSIEFNTSQDITFYSILGSSLSICISVNPTSGQMFASCGLDRESQARFEITVMANSGELVGTCNVVIDVMDVNDNAPVFFLDVYAELVNTRHGTNSSIIQVQAADVDYGENGTVTYALISVNGINASDLIDNFIVDEVTGNIFSQESILPVGDYFLSVEASDVGALNSTTQVLICVTEVRPPVVYFNSSTFTVEENLDPRTLIGYITLIASGKVVDPEDYRHSLFFVITGGDTLFDLANATGTTFTYENGYLFDVDPHSGAVYTEVSLDREAASSHIFTIRAYFTNGISVETLINVLVTDDNDMSPQFQPSSYFGMTNDTAEAETVVAHVTVTDLDTGSNGQVLLEIDSDVPFGARTTTTHYPYTSGEIFVTNSSEFMFRIYNFGIRAIDRGSIPLTSTAQVQITIEYDPPGFISFTEDTYQFEVTENSPYGTVAGSVSIEQITPALDGLVYSTQGENGMGYFIINATSGIISTTGIDREVLPYVNLTVVAFLPSEPSLEPAETSVCVFIEDVNDNYPVFSQENYLAVFLTTEISTTEELVQVEATDIDHGSNAQISFSIENVSPEEYTNDFYITQDGSIYTNNTNLSSGVYNLSVSAEDMGTLSLVSSVNVSVRVQYPVPDFINFTKAEYSFYAQENADPGTHVGYVQREPIPSHAEPYLSFSTDTTNFSVMTTTGEIQTLSVFDYESEQNYTFTVEAWMIISDRIPPVNISTSTSVTVFISDIDDNPPVFQDIPPTLSWPENRTSEEHIYHIQAVDLDAGSDNQQLEFEILNVDIHDKFRIDNDTGDLYIAAMLDREEREDYTITIQVSDLATPRNSIQRNISFMLLDINDNHPMIFIENNDLSQAHVESEQFIINDNTEAGTVVANISVMDIDAGNNGTVVLAINDDSPFQIETARHSYPYTYGQIVVTNTSQLIPGQYVINISAVDMGESPLWSSAQVTIRIEYALPEFISFPQSIYYFQAIENSPRGTDIGRVSVEQMTPALDELVYSIQEGNWEEFFLLNTTNGAITNVDVIDREIHPQLNFTISAFLPSEPSLEPAQTTVIVTVEDVNDNHPIFTQMVYSKVLLTTDISITDPLIQVMASDADSGSNAIVLFDIEDVSPQEYADDFYITQDGSIFTNSTNLTATTYYFSVSARDMGSSSPVSNANVTVTIIYPVPDTLNFTQPEGYTFSVNEGVASGTVIGQVQLDGVSSFVEQHVSFLTSHAMTNYSVYATTGLIQTLDIFDFEERHNYTFQVMARLVISSRLVDLTTSVNVTVLIVDVNDNEPVFVEFPLSLTWPENRTNEEMIYQVAATDADSGTNQLFVYEILNQDIQNKFRIDNQTGELYVSATLDREEHENYSITIQVSDSGSPPHTAQETINFRLQDINDNVPMLTSGLHIYVHERTEPRPLVNLSAVDPDLGNNGTVDFYKVQTTKNGSSQRVDILQDTRIITISPAGEVQLHQELDYEDAQWYIIIVQLRDRGTPYLESLYSITLSVIDVPDNNPQFMFIGGEMMYHNTTTSLLQIGDTITQVYATDEDPLDMITYTIGSILCPGNNSSPVPDLSIDMRTGRIYSTAEQELIPESSFEINVIAYDNGQYNLSSVALVQITVLPLTLQFVDSSYTVQISEAAPVNNEVVTVLLERLSVSSQVRYFLDVIYPAGQRSAFTFHYTSNGEVIINTTRELDRETAENYTVVVTADRGSELAQTTVFINITDINDNSPLFSDSPNTTIYASELLPPQAIIARVNVTDADIGENGRLQFQLNNLTAGAPFDIDVDTGDIMITEQLDYEMITTYSLLLVVTDFGRPPRQSSNAFIISVINENDIPPKFSAPAYFGEIYAHIPLNDHVRHTVLRVRDEDVTEDEQDIAFHISFLTGSPQVSLGYDFSVTHNPPYYIQVIQSPHEATFTEPQLFELQITATDDGGRGLVSTVPLYISVFTVDNLISFDVTGITAEELLSCVERENSICGFRESLSDVTEQALGEPVRYYNDSLRSSERSVNV